MSRPPETVAYAATDPDVYIESRSDTFPYASYSEWHACSETGKAGLIRTMQPLDSFESWERNNDPQGVKGLVVRTNRIRYMATTAFGAYVFPRVGVIVHPPYVDLQGRQPVITHDTQFPDPETFVSAINQIPRPDYPHTPAGPYDFPPQLHIFDGAQYPALLGLESLAERNTLLIGRDPEIAPHDMLVHGVAFLGMHRVIANACLEEVRAAYDIRVEDPYGAVRTAQLFDQNCTTYALQHIHGTSAKVTALGFEDFTGIPFDTVVAKINERLDDPLKPYLQ